MIGKESVRQRLDREGAISFTEFSYMILQSFDFSSSSLHGWRLQIGGPINGATLPAVSIHAPSTRAQVFGLTPLVTKADGTKLVKPSRALFG